MNQPKWDIEDTKMGLFKCIRWQVEETLDPINCPYHYYCETTYPGKNYPSAIDILFFGFITASYLATFIIMVISLWSRTRKPRERLHSKRYLLPSGPVSLPVILLALAKGQRINSVFPLTSTGPAILQLLHVSALVFENGADSDINYAFFEASSVSGILHASMYLDAIILPYYTGFDALVSSTLSGECPSCICRNERLVVGGKIVSYRGLSLTTFLVVGAMGLRIICRLLVYQNKRMVLIKYLFESLGWISIVKDCVYLTMNAPPQQSPLKVGAFGAILVLIVVHIVVKACKICLRNTLHR